MADEAAPWTIKNVPVPVREKAVRYAKMAGLTMSEWLARAVETEATRQDGDRIIPPGNGVHEAGKPEPPSFRPNGDLGTIAAALQSMSAAATAGLPVSKAAVRDTVALIREHVRGGRGLPVRQTRRIQGQTIGPDQET